MTELHVLFQVERGMDDKGNLDRAGPGHGMAGGMRLVATADRAWPANSKCAASSVGMASRALFGMIKKPTKTVMADDSQMAWTRPQAAFSTRRQCWL